MTIYILVAVLAVGAIILGLVFVKGTRKLETKLKETAPSTAGQNSALNQSATPTQDQTQEIQRYIDQAKARAREIIIEAKDESLRLKSSAEAEAARARTEVSDLEKKVADRLTQLDLKEKELDQKSQTVSALKDLVEKEKQRLEGSVRDVQEKLQSVSGFTKEEARKHLLTEIEKELTQEKAKRIKEVEEQVKADSERLYSFCLFLG